MATKHKLRAGVGDVTRTPSRKVIQRKLKTAEKLGDFEMRPGYLYTVVRAISARVNQNYDGWPSEELKKSYKTFIGKPVFVNHENYDPKKARGVVVASRYVEAGNDKYIEVIQEIDAKRFPKLAHEIKTGGLDSVSMGAEAGFTICSYCGNKATDVPDMCDHVLFHKGEKLSRFNKRTGKREEVLVYESCHKLSFFELSYVFDPADETAVASRVLVAAKDDDDMFAEPKGDKDRQLTINDRQKRKIDKGDKTVGDEVETNSGDGSDAEGNNAKTSAFEARVLTAAGFHVHSGQCAPGDPNCGSNLSDILQKAPALTDPQYGVVDGQGNLINHAVPYGPGETPGPNPAKPATNDSPAPAQGKTPVVAPAGAAPGLLSPENTNPALNNPVKPKTVAASKLATKCHYCAGDADDGFTSCTAHRPMEEKKFKAAVLKAAGYLDEDDFNAEMDHRNRMDRAHAVGDMGLAMQGIMPERRYQEPQAPARDPGRPLGDWKQEGATGIFHHPNGHQLRPSDEKPGHYQLWAPTVSMRPGGGGLAKDRQPVPIKDVGQLMDWAEKTGFRRQVLREFLGGPPPPADPQTGIQPSEGMNPEDYVVPFQGRGYKPGMPVEIYRNLHSDVRGQGLWSIKHRGLVVGHSDFAHMPDAKFFVGEGGNAKVQETGQKNVHAGVRGVLGPVPPGDHGPYEGITYNPKAGDTSFVHRETRAPVHGADHVHLGLDGKAYAVNPRGPQTFEARVIRAWGETEAPAAVDTLREEGSAPEDDSNDFYEYVKPPKELQAPDTSQAAQIDRDQEEMGQPDPMAGGAPQGDGSMGVDPSINPAQPQQQYMELKIPIPSPGQAGAQNAPSIPMQPYQPAPPMPPTLGAPAAPGMPPTPPQQQMQMAASTLSYFDQYFGRRVSRNSIELQTLQNERAVFSISRNPMKGTANMASSTLASRGKAVTAGRRQHFAEGPLVDTGDQSRNDQGEQEEIFLSQTPPAEPAVTPKDGDEISNTENNLVARVQRGRAQLLADAQKLQNLRAAKQRCTAGDQSEAGGPVATEVNPTVNTGPAAEALTGDDFESADPNADVVETQPKDASLHAFKTFDRWLAAKTGKPSRMHTSATIRRAADDFSRAQGISIQAMFPALGIVLREARKNDKVNTKGANMRKRADEKLEVAAPDGRIDVEAPTEDTTDAEAQASQFDLHDFGNNAGDNLADPDLSTDQNWAPGEANKTSKVKTAGGILGFRLAEAMIACGLEPNDHQRKYALAASYEGMNRGLVQDRIALCERFAGVLQQVARQQVASGSTRGANLKSPVPSGLTAGAQRTAATNRVAANDPRNDSGLFV